MNRLLLIFASIVLYAASAWSQTEQQASFPGGEVAMMNFIAEHLQYPATCAHVEGKVVVEFAVNELGKIGEVKVVRSVDPSLDNEAVRVVKLFPDFVPARHNGEAVASLYKLPIVFKTQENNEDVTFDCMGGPSYKDGEAAMMDTLSKIIVYPEQAVKDSIQGKVYVQFIVEVDGSVGEARIARGVHPLLDDETLRAVKLLPSNFIPAQEHGHPVATWCTIPVTFKLPEK